MLKEEKIFFAVLGHPIGHSLSPIMHNASMSSLNYKGSYSALDVHPEKLMDSLYSMSQKGFLGVNLTIPHKEVAFANLEYLDDSAKLFGAVNTISFKNQMLVGYNTDGYGFIEALKRNFGKGVEGENIFILGCGGAGRTVALQSACNNAKKLWLADVDINRIKKLRKEIQDLNAHIEIEYSTSLEQQEIACKQSNLVVQASPIGMKKEDKSLFSEKAFHKNQKVFDLIYMYPETDFLKTAKETGASIANGMDMLVFQGAKSFNIWTDLSPNIEIMRSSIANIIYKDVHD